MPAESNLDQELQRIVTHVGHSSEGVFAGLTDGEAIERTKSLVSREKFVYATNVLTDMFMAKAISEEDHDNWTKQLTEEFEASQQALYNTEEGAALTHTTRRKDKDE